MKANKQDDENIKFALSQKVNEIEPSKELFNKIRKNIYEEECGSKMTHKKFGFKKGKKLVIAMAASCLVLGSLTVVGMALGKNWVGQTAIKYLEFPSEKRISEDVGFIPHYTEALPGGFEYEMGGFGESELTDADGNVLTKTPHVTLSYKSKDYPSVLNLNVTQIQESFLERDQLQSVGAFEDVAFYYYEQTYKFVPEDYEITAEDQKAQEEGKLEISIGSSEVSVESVQGLSWYDGGLEYMLMANDCNFTVEQMIDMAKVIILEE